MERGTCCPRSGPPQPCRFRLSCKETNITTSLSAVDQVQDNLHKREHFVVLMLENRSFDQMLGHLELEGHDVDGVKPAEDKHFFNWYNGKKCEVEPLERTALTWAEDPCHD